jgi:hypothetical protein
VDSGATHHQYSTLSGVIFAAAHESESGPKSNTNLNRILLSHATQNVTATFAFVQKLSQAKNFQDVVKIQTEFMETQMNSFNEQAKILGEIYTKAAAETMKAPSLSPRE